MNLQYPVGQFQWPQTIEESQLASWIDEIADLPKNLQTALAGLTDEQLDTPYRPDGWTLRQVVHHIADSHMNSYIRFKLALTEDTPTIRTYNEADWAELPEARTGDLSLSLPLIDALHKRWAVVLRTLTPAQLSRQTDHPEWSTPARLDQVIALYAWHSRHHLAHITHTREAHGW